MATTIRHATANLFKDLSLRDVKADLNEFMRLTDVVGIQEAYPEERKAIQEFKKRGWGVYWPGGTATGVGPKPNDANQIPIMWRTELFTLVDKGHRQTYAGGHGDGPSRGISWVVLKHKKSGDYVVHLNTHFIAKAWTDFPKRRSVWLLHERILIEVARNLAKRWGSCVGGGDMNRDHHDIADFQMVYSNQSTFKNKRYDYFFVAGKRLTVNTERVINTNSDHDAFIASFAAIPGKEAEKPPPRPIDKPIFVEPDLPSVNQRTRPTTNRWRYIAMELTGEGGMGPLVQLDIPLSDVTITKNLSGYDTINGTIKPKHRRLVAPDGEPVFKEWSHAIFAENDGEIRAGGILKTSTFDNEAWNIETVGYAGYADEMPWVTDNAGNYLGVEVDPFDVLRVIWNHIQSQPGGNIGLEIPNTKAGYKIGVKLEQVEYDTQSGPLAFESGPVQINWYSDSNLAERINSLATATPFDWREQHWWDGDTIRHALELGYPRLGVRQEGLRLVVGENVFPVPSITRDGSDYATEVLVLGAGEGRAMIRGGSNRQRGRGLRRVAVVQDSSVRTVRAANTLAQDEMAWRQQIDEISSFVIRNTSTSPNGSYEVGDEVYLASRVGWRNVGAWVRITSMTIAPNASDVTEVNVIRSDRLSA